MGLETVELVINVEDDFGISIPDDEASRVITVEDLCKLVLNLYQAKFCNGALECPSAQIFYRLRQELNSEFGIGRKSVRPSVVLGDLIVESTKRRKWPMIARTAGLRPPRRSLGNIFSPRFPDPRLTIRQIISEYSPFHSIKPGMKLGPEEIFLRIRKLISETMNIKASEIFPQSRFIQDLRMG